MARCGAGNAGNVNMRGRSKVHMFRCQCCWCIDDREELLTRQELKEAQEAMADYDQNGGTSLKDMKRELGLE